jgi:two-component system phosphate regulon sensor histidine kinase PhoR
MKAVLSVSILILIFIIACLIYELKIFIKKDQLTQLRKNFIHALTHDLKTPLATIHSVLIQLENDKVNPDMRKKFIAIAIDQALNLQAIVNRILTLAYNKKKQLSLNKQPINLPEMIQSLVDKFTVKSDKTIVFKTACDLTNDSVYADPLYLKNAVSNLIDNAIKYSEDPVQIEIKCSGGEKQVDIHVKDNGLGISSNDQLKIFKQFERGAEIKRNRISGFGIGLNYVQRVVEVHGGTVTVLSREGIGSEFIITLPLQ